MSWVTLDRICQEEADGKEDVRRELVRNGKPLRSSAEPLSDDELLAKLRDFGRPDEARQFGEQAERLRHEPLPPAARPVPPPGNPAPPAGNIARRVKVGRNAPCPCGSGKKFKKCCGSPAEAR